MRIILYQVARSAKSINHVQDMHIRANVESMHGLDLHGSVAKRQALSAVSKNAVRNTVGMHKLSLLFAISHVKYYRDMSVT